MCCARCWLEGKESHPLLGSSRGSVTSLPWGRPVREETMTQVLAGGGGHRTCHPASLVLPPLSPLPLHPPWPVDTKGTQCQPHRGLPYPPPCWDIANHQRGCWPCSTLAELLNSFLQQSFPEVANKDLIPLRSKIYFLREMALYCELKPGLSSAEWSPSVSAP